MESKVTDDSMFANGSNATNPSSEVFDVVRSCVVGVLGVQPELVVAEATLLDLGAQSFDFIQLVISLEKKCDVQIPRVFAIPERHTVYDYVEAVAAALESP